MKTKLLLLLLAILFTGVFSAFAAPIHVLVWDERQDRQAEAYDNFLGNEIATQLTATTDDLELRSVALDDPEQGLSEGNLEWADVIIWWGHARHSDVTPENSKRVLDRVLSGKVDLIALHSSHWARPFVDTMNWRSVEDAKAHFAEVNQGKITKIDTVAPPKERTVPTHGSALTPTWFSYKKNKSISLATVHLPWCCFPDYRPDGEPGTLATKLPEHPIAKGVSAKIVVPQTEMYNEPFHVPNPDEVVFEETWELGERFRSGMVWNIGKGKVFYFRPGHEQYAVFKQPEMIQILANACHWMGNQ